MPGGGEFRRLIFFLGYSFVALPFWVSGAEVRAQTNPKVPMELAQEGESRKKAEGAQREKGLTEQARKIPMVTVESRKGEVILTILAFHLFTPEIDLTRAGKETLDQVGALLKKVPDVRIVVKGHTDSTGPEEINQTISRRRADRVRDYLVTAQQVPPRRIVAEGQGPSRPVATNATEAGRALNRRVEIFILTGE